MLSKLSTAKEFMSTKLVTAYSQSNVSKAVKLMVDYNIGSIVIKDNEGPVGIFTERDLLSNVLARQKKLEEPILMEVMTPSYNTLSPDSTLFDAARIMTEKKGRLVVFEDGKLIGIVTATDIIREIQKSGKPFDFANSYSPRIYEEGPQTKVELVVKLMDKRRIGSVIISEGKFPRGIFTERDLLRSVLMLDFRMEDKVEDFATHHLVTAEEGINGLHVVELMNRHHIKRLPLTRAGQLFGIVTARDLVEGFANSSW
jgi:CBS domain-containing protein